MLSLGQAFLAGINFADLNLMIFLWFRNARFTYILLVLTLNCSR
jgi:hypothetical protein